MRNLASSVGVSSVCLLATAAAIPIFGACHSVPPAAPAEAVKGAALAPPLPDTTAVAEPTQMLVFGRVARPSAAIGTSLGWLQAQLGQVPPVGSDAVTELLTGETVGDLIDLDQPIDVAATAPARRRSKGHFAVSAAVTSPEKAKAQLSAGGRKLVPGEGGMLRVEGLGPPPAEGEDDSERRACALVPAATSTASTSPVRLVCGFGPGSLEALAPWLARSAPRMTTSSDVHLELRFTPVHGFITENRRMIGPLLGSALRSNSNASAVDLVISLLNEVADYALDVETMTLDAKLSESAADATFATRYRGNTSVLARMSLERADRNDVPPPAFLRLPADAELALFHRGFEEKDLEKPREAVLDVVGKELAKDGLAPVDAKPMTDAIAKLFTPAPMVLATGSDGAALASGKLEEDAARAAVFGWRAFGFEEAPARLVGAAKDLVGAWNRPAFQKFVKAQNRDKPPTTLRLVPLAKGVTLPKDTQHLELAISARPSSPAKAEGAKKGAQASAAKMTRFHVYVVPDVGQTWVVVAMTDELAAARARAMLSGAPEAASLAARAGLEQVRQAKIHSGGFVTLQALVGSLGAVRAGGPEPNDVWHMLAEGPGKGASPIPILHNVQGQTSTTALRIPRAVVEDVVKLAMRGGLRF